MLVFGPGGGVAGVGGVEVGLWRLSAGRGGRDVVDVVTVWLEVSRSAAVGLGQPAGAGSARSRRNAAAANAVRSPINRASERGWSTIS